MKSGLRVFNAFSLGPRSKGVCRVCLCFLKLCERTIPCFIHSCLILNALATGDRNSRRTWGDELVRYRLWDRLWRLNLSAYLASCLGRNMGMKSMGIYEVFSLRFLRISRSWLVCTRVWLTVGRYCFAKILSIHFSICHSRLCHYKSKLKLKLKFTLKLKALSTKNNWTTLYQYSQDPFAILIIHSCFYHRQSSSNSSSSSNPCQQRAT